MTHSVSHTQSPRLNPYEHLWHVLAQRVGNNSSVIKAPNEGISWKRGFPCQIAFRFSKDFS